MNTDLEPTNDLVEVAPGEFQTREAATWALAALADAHSQGRPDRRPNVTNVFLFDGPSTEDGADNFRDRLSRPRGTRH